MEGRRRVRQRRLPGDHRALRLAARVFQPQTRKARALAEKDLESGDELGAEFMAVSQRLSQVGTIAGVIVVVTVFFMAYKPFL